MSKEIAEYENALAFARRYLEDRKQINPHEYKTLETWSDALGDYQGLLADYKHTAASGAKHFMADAVCTTNVMQVRSLVVNLHPQSPLQDLQSDLGQLEDSVQTFLRADPHGPALPRPKIGGGGGKKTVG